MHYRILGKTSLRVPVLGFGASSLGSEFRKIDESEGIRTVHRALDLGITYFDVAPYYGRTTAETLLGCALSGISRDRYLLATKVGRYDVDRFDFSASRVTRSVEESLGRLGVDVIDIIQCHDIEFVDLDQIIHETLPALRRLQETGKVRFVGITGLPLKIFRTVLEQTEVDTILSFCRYALNDTGLLDLIPLLKARGVGILNASPLSMRLLTQAGPPDWHPAPPSVKARCAEAARFCAQRGADIATLALQFAVQNPDIPCTLVGTANPDNLERNVRSLEEPLDEALLEDVLAILLPIKNVTWPSGRPENNDDGS